MTPRYDGARVLAVQGPVGNPSLPLLRQRRRLAGVLATLGPEQWASRSRCERWSVRDVIAHLAGINELWEMSISRGRAGTPTRLFRAFDPVKTPPLLVDAMHDLTAAEVLARFVVTTEGVADAVDGLDEATWSLTGETPLGHVALHVVAMHALWDSWIHERDVLLPLGIAPVEEVDEVVAALSYAAALGPALLAAGGSTRRGTLVVDATDPEVQVVVEAGPSVVVRPGQATHEAVMLTGRAVELAEALSFRRPQVVVVAAQDQWLLSGLSAAFDST